MDNKQMIHVACEGLLIGGISLYFSKQIKQVKKEVEELKAVISKNQGANEKRFEVIFNFLDNINGGFMPPQQPVREVKPIKVMKQTPKLVAKPLPKKVVKKTEVKELPQEEDDLKEIEEERKMLLDEEECGDDSCPLESEEVIEEGGVEEDVEEHI
jgi:hypothetical protein